MSLPSKMLTPVSLCSMTTGDTLALGVAVGLPVLLGYLAGSHVRKFKVFYYRDVLKSSFIPPSWVFAPTWTILYALMGYASYLVYLTGQAHSISITRPLVYYVAQLAFNLCWPALFFRYRNIKVALYIITANLVLALIATYKFGQVNMQAAQLMVPYLVWLTLAGYINKDMWRKNQANKLLAKEKLFAYPSNQEVAKAKLNIIIAQSSTSGEQKAE
ncbi:hypothetical protein DSO57_1038920 [Entomophthora muscae]|uniref:Uncharacterized protein n=2 Tax=Entomophthora muscae TaxID=34485 RepID=A0ACC2SE97_9FUNG|nr:hypothetical protein DSO57_1028762 [Entomophthora muscae]KAJ9075149.1 hypothetical protein DSO57_1038920 [Entomophthora muscae]